MQAAAFLLSLKTSSPSLFLTSESKSREDQRSHIIVRERGRGFTLILSSNTVYALVLSFSLP